MRMTRIVTVLALVLAAAPGLSAQDTAPAPAATEKKLHWSLQGGAAFTMLTGTAADTADLSNRVGGYGTFGLEYRLSPSFGLSAEATLIQKGGKQSTAYPKPGLGYRLLYVEFPLLAKWNLSPRAKWQPVLLAGPTFAFELDCKMPFAYLNSVIDSNCYSLDYSHETTDIGGVAGIELHKGKWFLNARYMMGFTSLLSGEGAPDLTNSGFQAGLGISF